MTEKLTPRVGDRVIVKYAGKTCVGTISDRAPETWGDWLVSVDGSGHCFCGSDDLTVVDREPVEWPEGWGRSSDYPGCVSNGAHVYERYRLENILATGPDMLARWDELMRES